MPANTSKIRACGVNSREKYEKSILGELVYWQVYEIYEKSNLNILHLSSKNPRKDARSPRNIFDKDKILLILSKPRMSELTIIPMTRDYNLGRYRMILSGKFLFSSLKGQLDDSCISFLKFGFQD
jgi:hypothetical protein